MIQWKEMNQEANKYLKELDADFDATAEMGTLSVAQQQMVEIAKHFPQMRRSSFWMSRQQHLPETSQRSFTHWLTS